MNVADGGTTEVVDVADGADGGRWVGAGGSTTPDVTAAVDEALASALQGRAPSLVVAFVSPVYPLDRVAEVLADRLGEVPVLGCSTAGEVATSGVSDSGMVLWAIGGAGFDVAVGFGEGDEEGLRAAAAEAAGCALTVEQQASQVLVLLADGLCGNQVEVVRGAYSVVGAAVPLVGGSAGDDLAMERTQVLSGTVATSEAVVAAAISSPAPIGIGVAHGWREVGDPMLVTASDEVIVETLDDRPALDVYLDAFGAPDEVRADETQFVEFAVTRPLGLVRRGRTEVRYVAGADYGRRTLRCIAEVPQGAAVHLLEGDEATVLDATDAACAAAVDGLEGRPPIGVLAFDCVARRSVLAEGGVQVELDRISAATGGVPVAGFYTYGEIARTSGSGGFHNQTLVVVAFA